MIALYRQGTSVLHRSPAWLKLLALLLLAIVLVAIGGVPWASAVALVVVAALFVVAGFGFAEPFVQLWRVRWLILVMVVIQLWFVPLVTLTSNTLRVLAMVLAAALLSMTTSVEAMLDTLERIMPQTLALLLSLTITSIPVLLGFVQELREAVSARGVPSRRFDVTAPVRFVVPLLVRSLRHADDLGDAIAARGVR